MLKLRIANINDCELLFIWANEKSVRENSFDSNKLVLENHKRWFNSKLNDNNCKIFIATINDESVGQIRIEIINNIGIIAYSVDYRYRGQGIGTQILRLIKDEIKDVSLVGKVKKENIASIKAFEKANYKKIEHEDYIEFISN